MAKISTWKNSRRHNSGRDRPIIKITNQGNELLVEEGVRVEIMCQAKGRPQPEVKMAMPMLVILVPILPIAKVTEGFH